jgi:hypothetical protein
MIKIDGACRMRRNSVSSLLEATPWENEIEAFGNDKMIDRKMADRNND